MWVRRREHRWAILVWCQILLSASFAPPAIGASELIRFQDRTAAEVLRDYEQLGLEFIYSNDVLDTGQRFVREPAQGVAIMRLRQALSQLGATLRIADHNRRWLIVRAPRNEQVQPSTRAAVARAATSSPLPTSKRMLEEVVVVASRYALQNEFTSGTQFDALQLQTLPELSDDPLRRVNHIPGVASLGLSAQTHVRGGDVDETLILFDGIELLQPYHLRNFNSVFSGVHPGTVDHIDVYTGGFPARYGGRMGAILDIGARQNLPELGAELQLSPFATAAVAYGSSARAEADGQKREWLVAARRSNLTAVANRVKASIGSPDYQDGLVEGSWQIENRTFGIGALLYDDNAKLHETNKGVGAADESNDRSRYVWLSGAKAGAQWTTRAVLHVADLEHNRRGMVNDPDVDESIGRIEDRSHFRRIGLEQSLRWQRGDSWNFDTGYNLRFDTAEYRYQGRAKRGDLATILGVPTDFVRDIDLHLWRTSLALYGSAKWQILDSLRAEFGARVEGERDRGNGVNDVAISPRVSIRYDVGPDTDVRVSLGRFRQAQGLYELQVADDETRLQRAQIADHAIIGLDQRFANNKLRLHVEAFAKRTEHPKRRYENLFAAQQLVTELSPDRVQVVSQKARSRGVEMQLNVQPVPELGASLSYTRAVAEERIAGVWAPRAWDQKDTLQASVLWTPAQWTIAAGVTWHSGWRITHLPPNLAALEPLAYRRNNDNLSDFYSVDVRVSRLWAWEHQSFLLFGDVTNLTNHHNIGAITYQFSNQDDNGPLLIEHEHERLFPIVPTIGFVWKFF